MEEQTTSMAETTNFTMYCEAAVDSADVAAVCDLYSEIEQIQGTVPGINIFFLIFSGALVFLMQAGFAMLCAGAVRERNVKNTMLKSLSVACGGALGFFSLGFAFAFGDDERASKTFIGGTYFCLRNFDNFSFFFFQLAYAVTSAAIIAGSLAERCKLSAYVCVAFVHTGFVYPVVAHSVWTRNGFLSSLHAEAMNRTGTVDFSGAGVVHMTGGLTALVGALVLGPRKGRFHDEDGKRLKEPHFFPPHNPALQLLGTFILWVGWYGLNPGSSLAIANADSAEVASLCLVTTTLGATCGGLSALFIDSILEARHTGETTYDLHMAMNGTLSGLVAVTAGCSVFRPWIAAIVGVVAGWIFIAFSKLLVNRRVDDPVDAAAVHFANGLWGVIAVGLLANANDLGAAGYNTEHQGLLYGIFKGDFSVRLLVNQIAFAAWIIGWVAVFMIPFFFLLKVCRLLRVNPLDEEIEEDESEHEEAEESKEEAPKNETGNSIENQMLLNEFGGEVSPLV